MARYTQTFAPQHPRASSSGHISRHVLIAEQALGHFLPAGAQVHHVDGDKHHNVNWNLVICQDGAYHKLLHVRTRVLKAGGNPNTDRFCGYCQTLKPLNAFYPQANNKSTGRHSVCRGCNAIRGRIWRDARRGRNQNERRRRVKASLPVADARRA